MDNVTIYEGSKPGFRSTLDIFELPPTDVSVEATSWLTVTPSTSIRESYNPIIFNIQATQTQYYDLANSYLYVKVILGRQDYI
jgi:hypothetical protein